MKNGHILPKGHTQRPAGAHTLTLCHYYFGIFLSKPTFAWHCCWHNEREISREADPAPGNLLHHNHLIIWLELLGAECFEDTLEERGWGREERHGSRKREKAWREDWLGNDSQQFFVFFFFYKERKSFLFPALVTLGESWWNMATSQVKALVLPTLSLPLTVMLMLLLFRNPRTEKRHRKQMRDSRKQFVDLKQNYMT